MLRQTNLKKVSRQRALALVARKRSFEEFSRTETLKKNSKNKKIMVNNNQIPIEVNKKPFETVQELKEVQLPKLSEITDKDEKVKLPPELIAKLRDPNARFRVDLMVFPA